MSAPCCPHCGGAFTAEQLARSRMPVFCSADCAHANRRQVVSERVKTRGPKARYGGITIPNKKPLTEEERAERWRLVIDPPPAVRRPRSRLECAGKPGACPFVSCRYNLYLEVTENGSLHLNFPQLEVDELEYSCAFDIAEAVAEDRRWNGAQGGAALELADIGARMNLSGARIHQIELIAKLSLMRKIVELRESGEWTDAA